MRTATISRKTAETDIELTLNLDGSGESDVSSGVGFLDHMLTLFARHGRFDLTLSCVGDTQVDDHHSVEDIGIFSARRWRRPWATNAASAATATRPCPWTKRWC